MCQPEDEVDLKVLPPPAVVTSQLRSRFYKRMYLVAAGFVVMCIVLVVLLVLRNQTSNGDSSASAIAGAVPTASDGVAVPSPAPLAPTPGATGAPTISIPDFVEQVILPVAIFGGSEFDDPRSYQSKALIWLQADAATDDGTGQVRLSARRLFQRYALACIYFATNAVSHSYTDLEFGVGWVDPWYNETGWLSAASVCEWYGVTCESSSSSSDDMYVVELSLQENRLTGSFPREATLLTRLKWLDLYNNLLWNQGDEGNAWLGDMVSLEYLFYGSTYFDYDAGVPTQLSRLVNLSTFHARKLNFPTFSS